MPSEALWFGVPRWLVVGLAIGFAASVCAACLFYIGTRWFPGAGDEGTTSGSNTDSERRTVEIREYLDAIGESYAENHPVDGRSVEFYLPERDVAITFDPRTFYRLERGPTHPVLVEHELPGIHLGSRLPFETPEVDLGPDPEERDLQPYDEAFAVLGLQRGASESEVRRAYRERVKEAPRTTAATRTSSGACAKRTRPPERRLPAREQPPGRRHRDPPRPEVAPVSRVEITDEVREQLAEALESEEIDHPLNRGAIQYAAWELDLDELAAFVGEADASTYYEALRQVGVEPRAGGENTGGYDPELDG